MMNNELAIEGLLKIAKVGQSFEKAGVKGYSNIWRDSVYFYWEQWKIPKFSKMRIHSKNASSLLNRDRNHNPGGCVYEHAIPFSCLRKKLGFKIIDENNIHRYLTYIIGVNITKNENIDLNNVKCGQNMPTNWDEKDLFARYKEAKIELVFPVDWKTTYGLSYLSQQGVGKI